MIAFSPYKHVDKLIKNQTFEPTLSWGLRMAVSAVLPILWGIATGQMAKASWIVITAEVISWVELKGSFAQRLRVLLGGAFLAALFALLGGLTGKIIWLSVLAMLGVGFLAALFKNLGDRGSGLAICVQVLFVISNAYPPPDAGAMEERLILVLIGGLWTTLVGVAASVFEPNQQPFRRTIALIWRANAQLAEVIYKGWDGRSARSSIRDIFLKEKEIRTVIDNSFHFFETMAFQAQKTEKEKYHLVQLRKATALIAANLIAVSEELEQVRIKEVNPELRLKIYDALRVLGQALDRMGIFVINLKPEEKLLIESRILRLEKLIALLRDEEKNKPFPQLSRVIQLLERTLKLIEVSQQRIRDLGEDAPVFQSYSLIETTMILHPQHWQRNLRLLFSFSGNTLRYAIRSAVAAALGVLVYKLFDINYGYWLPFTALIVVQPYFSATIKKAVDRVLGTLAGGIAGGVILMLSPTLIIKETILFLCFIMMVYFIRKRYAVAVFFITLSVVMLFDVEDRYNSSLIITRALSTVTGAVFGLVAGFLLLPTWDKKWLPVHLSEALSCNYQYFLATFFPKGIQASEWTRFKRNAESKNSNAFDSFTRYMREPLAGKRYYLSFYQLINHSIRITRELNNIHLERESGEEPVQADQELYPQKCIEECLEYFHKNLHALERFQKGISRSARPRKLVREEIPPMTSQQVIHLEKLLIELKTLYENLGHIRR